MYGIIYKVMNLIDNKSYIGQATDFERRKYKHIWLGGNNRDNNYFHNALRKYGIDNFKWEILCECSSKEELNEKEQQYIQLYNSKVPNGYNLTYGGEGSFGYKHTDEAKKKMSESKIGKKSYWYSRKHTDETKKRMSENNYNKGRKLSDLEKLNMSEISKKCFEITYPNGQVKIVKGLKQWCIDNNLDYVKVKKRKNNLYKNYIIVNLNKK